MLALSLSNMVESSFHLSGSLAAVGCVKDTRGTRRAGRGPEIVAS
jgi:hypothetical protein